jgi:hypothetical protein
MFLDITSWWDALDWFERIYWIIALPSTLTFVFILFTTFFGGDMDSDMPDVDSEIDGDSGIGFQFITFKNLVGFFTIFSWIGLACIHSELSTSITLVISALSGLAMMFIMAGIYYMLSTMVDDGTLKVKNAIGRLGEVYMNIPPKGEGIGKIQISVQGSVREMSAITNEEEMLKMGTVVKVLEVIDEHILLVTKNTQN